MLKEKVTIEREVPSCLADLVHFARFVAVEKQLSAATLSDARLVALAREFWERQHGED